MYSNLVLERAYSTHRFHVMSCHVMSFLPPSPLSALILSIVYVCITWLHFVTLVVSIIQSHNFLHCWQYFYDGEYHDEEWECSDQDYRVMITFYSILIVTAYAQMFAAIWTIILISKAIHRRRDALLV